MTVVATNSRLCSHDFSRYGRHRGHSRHGLGRCCRTLGNRGRLRQSGADDDLGCRGLASIMAAAGCCSGHSRRGHLRRYHAFGATSRAVAGQRRPRLPGAGRDLGCRGQFLDHGSSGLLPLRPRPPPLQQATGMRPLPRPRQPWLISPDAPRRRPRDGAAASPPSRPAPPRRAPRTTWRCVAGPRAARIPGRRAHGCRDRVPVLVLGRSRRGRGESARARRGAGDAPAGVACGGVGRRASGVGRGTLIGGGICSFGGSCLPKCPHF